jgi:hypothetical protein
VRDPADTFCVETSWIAWMPGKRRDDDGGFSGNPKICDVFMFHRALLFQRLPQDKPFQRIDPEDCLFVNPWFDQFSQSQHFSFLFLLIEL